MRVEKPAEISVTWGYTEMDPEYTEIYSHYRAFFDRIEVPTEIGVRWRLIRGDSEMVGKADRQRWRLVAQLGSGDGWWRSSGAVAVGGTARQRWRWSRTRGLQR